MQRRLRTLPALIVPAALAAVVSMTGTAGASWSTSGAGASKAKATQLPVGSTPSLAQTGTAPSRAVNLSWTAAGTLTTGYVVRAFNATTGVERATVGTCAGTITGTSCSETTAPSGTWKYTVTPRRSNWSGTPSASSASMLVDNVNPTGSITSPSGGVVTQVVTVTSNSADSGGSGLATATFQYRPGSSGPWTTIGTPTAATSASWDTRTLSDGAYQLQVVTTDGAGNSTTSAAVSVTVDNPKVTSVTLNNRNGTATSGDTITLVWSSAMNATSFCSGWTPSTGNGSISGNGTVTVTITNNAANGNDDILKVSVPTGTCSGNGHFGTVNLGANYTTGTVTFSGNGTNQSKVDWNASTKTMTITLGTGSATAASSTGLSYTPDAAVTDSTGTTPIGPWSFSGQVF
jgi:hypothetical protein